MMSSDPGERWYQLIQNDGDLVMIARSLHARAERLRTDSKSRKYSGAGNAKARQMLRDEADECILIAQRAEKMSQ